MGMTIDEIKKLEHFVCSDCSGEEEAKVQMDSFRVPREVSAVLPSVRSASLLRS